MSTSNLDPNLPKQIGAINIESKIGEGAVATVYKGTEVNLGVTRAIKVFHPYLLQNTDFLLRIQREAQIAASKYSYNSFSWPGL